MFEGEEPAEEPTTALTEVSGLPASGMQLVALRKLAEKSGLEDETDYWKTLNRAEAGDLISALQG